MPDPQHTQWAAMLKKTKQQQNHKAGKSLVLEKKQIDEEIDYYKKKLKNAQESTDVPNMRSSVKKLVNLRAKLLAIRIKTRKEGGEVDPGKDKTDIEAYYKDCYSLLHAVGLEMPLE